MKFKERKKVMKNLLRNRARPRRGARRNLVFIDRSRRAYPVKIFDGRLHAIQQRGKKPTAKGRGGVASRSQ